MKKYTTIEELVNNISQEIGSLRMISDGVCNLCKTSTWYWPGFRKLIF